MSADYSHCHCEPVLLVILSEAKNLAPVGVGPVTG
jgi:hypothetical protein